MRLIRRRTGHGQLNDGVHHPHRSPGTRTTRPSDDRVGLDHHNGFSVQTQPTSRLPRRNQKLLTLRCRCDAAVLAPLPLRRRRFSPTPPGFHFTAIMMRLSIPVATAMRLSGVVGDGRLYGWSQTLLPRCPHCGRAATEYLHRPHTSTIPPMPCF